MTRQRLVVNVTAIYTVDDNVCISILKQKQDDYGDCCVTKHSLCYDIFSIPCDTKTLY